MAKKVVATKKAAPKVRAVKGNTVAWYIGTLKDDQAELVRELDSLILKTVPKATSSIKWAQPVYESDGPFCFMKAAKNHVTFGFWRGADLDDEKGLLEGTGDKMRHIKIRTAGDIQSTALRKLINQAVKLNNDDGDPSMKKTGKAAVKKKATATKTSPPGRSKKTTGKAGTPQQPWTLATPSGQSEFTAYRDATLDPPAVVVQVGKTQLRYHLRCIDDLHAMLKKRGDWMLLGSADEQKPAKAGTVEEWARSSKNPVRGWYGLKKGFRGRFANYVPPILKELGLAEVEAQPRNNRMRAL